MAALIVLAVLAVSVLGAQGQVCTGSYVQLVVSPVLNENETRKMEYHYVNLEFNFGYSIEYGDYPRNLSQTPYWDGNGYTNTEEKHVEVQDLGYKQRCLNHYVAYYNLGELRAATCLDIQPTWMEDIKELIGNKTIGDLYIPGTHASGAYKNLSSANAPLSKEDKFFITQDEPILAQLIYGIRYLDLHVGYFPNETEPFWTTYKTAKFNPLSEALKEITTFLNNTNEIVILDIQTFSTGFNNIDDYNKLASFLQAELEDYAVPSSLTWNATVDEIWASGKQLIIGFNNTEVVEGSSLLWPTVNLITKHSNILDNLAYFWEQELINPTERRPGVNAYSAYLELTDTDVEYGLYDGLRNAAQKIALQETYYFRYIEVAQNANIIVTDFFRASGLLQASIQYNAYSATLPCPILHI